ncbi:MAG: hypothetical protein DYH03_07385 [Nitrospira sp. NTP1]|nr:hypothetical protein [Nitrospira sp. NTP1]
MTHRLSWCIVAKGLGDCQGSIEIGGDTSREGRMLKRPDDPVRPLLYRGLPSEASRRLQR